MSPLTEEEIVIWGLAVAVVVLLRCWRRCLPSSTMDN